MVSTHPIFVKRGTVPTGVRRTVRERWALWLTDKPQAKGKEIGMEYTIKKGRGLFPSLLHVVLHKLFGIFFEDVVDFIDQLVDVLFHFLPGLDDFRVRLDLFLVMGFFPGFRSPLLFLHRSTSSQSGTVTANRLSSHYPRAAERVKPTGETRTVVRPSTHLRKLLICRSDDSGHSSNQQIIRSSDSLNERFTNSTI